jgi:hypothetical protein
VTGFWGPEALERDPDRRPADVYLRLFAELQGQVPWPMVVWVDPTWADAVAAIVARAAPAERRVIPRAFDALPYAKERGALETLRPFDNHDPRKDTIGFSVVMWAKPELVVDAIGLEGPGSERWAWIDFGMAHVADLGAVDWRAIEALAPERVRLCTMRATAPEEIENLAEFYRGNRGKVAGGFFTGSADAMRGLRARFHAELGRMRATGRRVHDEQIFATLLAREPGTYECWYADYAGILTNYAGIRRDVPTILDGLAYCRDRRLWTIGTDVFNRLMEAMQAQHVLLTPAQTARLLHEAFICAYHAERPLAERLGRLLASLYHHGGNELRRTLDAWAPLVAQNLRYVDLDFARPAWTLAELLAQPDLAAWRVCL